MCHDTDSQPSAPPRVGGVAGSGDLLLSGSDGTQFGASAARPREPAGADVVVLPDVRGLHRYHRAVGRGRPPAAALAHAAAPYLAGFVCFGAG